MDPLEQQTPEAKIQPEETYDAGHHAELPHIRTFNSDLAQAIREKGGSVVRVAIAENERHQKDEAERSIKSKKNLFFTILGTIVILGAIGLAAWSYIHKKSTAVQTPTTTLLPSSLITSDTAQVIDASGMQVSDLVTAIQSAAADPSIQPGTVKNIVVTNGPTARIPSTQFLTILGTHAPAGFTSAILPDFMIGAYGYSGGHLFIIMHGTAHDFLLAGMLAWEPYLFNDMTPLFGIDTSGFTKSEIQSVPFKDAIIANRDARAVLDPAGKPLFFYSFLDPNTIIFTSDPKTLTEAVSRY